LLLFHESCFDLELRNIPIQHYEIKNFKSTLKLVTKRLKKLIPTMDRQ
jgi:hypothetical protein